MSTFRVLEITNAETNTASMAKLSIELVSTTRTIYWIPRIASAYWWGVITASACPPGLAQPNPFSPVDSIKSRRLDPGLSLMAKPSMASEDAPGRVSDKPPAYTEIISSDCCIAGLNVPTIRYSPSVWRVVLLPLSVSPIFRCKSAATCSETTTSRSLTGMRPFTA